MASRDEDASKAARYTWRVQEQLMFKVLSGRIHPSTYQLLKDEAVDEKELSSTYSDERYHLLGASFFSRHPTADGCSRHKIMEDNAHDCQVSP